MKRQLMSGFATTFSMFTATTDTNVAPPSRLAKKLRHMAQLPPRWSRGEGVPVTAAAIKKGEEFLELATLLQLKADVFPEVNGGCAIAFYRDEERIEVTIPPDGSGHFGLRVERGLGFQFEDVIEPVEDATWSQAVKQISALIPKGFPIWRCGIRLMDGAFGCWK